MYPRLCSFARRCLPVAALLLCLGALFGAVPAMAQEEFSISASPSPATVAEEVTLVISGEASCPQLGPVTVGPDRIEVELRDNCPFIPPNAAPFTLETTVGPLEEGTYELILDIATGEVLATGELVVLGSGVCIPTDTVLCLNERRFQVQVDWRTNAGDFGEGKAVSLTDDSGYFYFFNPENIELVVKVLNACQDPFNHYWVFAAGLTNVEVAITVTDLETGAVKSYLNPINTAFLPIQDTRAFATCP